MGILKNLTLFLLYTCQTTYTLTHPPFGYLFGVWVLGIKPGSLGLTTSSLHAEPSHHPLNYFSPLDLCTWSFLTHIPKFFVVVFVFLFGFVFCMVGSPVTSSKKLFLTELRVCNLELTYMFVYFDFIYLYCSSCTIHSHTTYKHLTNAE